MINEPSVYETKEIYAHFGLAFYCSNVLEHGIANALLILELMEGRGGAKTRQEWEALVDRHYDESFEKTFGKLRQRLTQNQQSPVLNNVMGDLGRCVDERNYLAHHFWREHAEHWFTPKGRAEMVQRLEKARELFSETDKALDAALQPSADRHGLTVRAQYLELEKMRQEAIKRC